MSGRHGHGEHEVARGIRAGFVAYAIWGLLTIYWKQLHDFEPFELIGWRIATSSVIMIGVLTVRGRWPALRAAFGSRRLMTRISVAALLLTANWTAYVYAVLHDRVIETALGYFIAPLGTMALGIFVLKERPTQAQRTAMGLAAIAVVILTMSYGRLPYAALTIAVTWSLYGLLKRQVPLGAVESLAAETFVLFVPALVMVGVMAGRSGSIPRTADATELTLTSLSGVATVVPLVMFAFAATRVPFTILGPLTYLVPTINFLLGWILYDEALPGSRVVGFVLVWIALAIVTVARVRTTVADRRDPQRNKRARLRTATPD
jgi:chloramphenicol-sensitive protein RarD